ncbi:salicylate synthase [Cupriavidus sp. BIS7]|uniref:salicylate synthase n=1 Tax=Cupriavidus sp. BIS7 TaxID=1217718 RepID=UPI0002DF6D85|nr:salicylate synthase [Cupriavidus sp. BIS7]
MTTNLDALIASDDTLDMHLRAWVAQHRHRTALVAGNQRLSYLELEDRVRQLAGGLATLGITAGDHVLLQLPNGIGFPIALLALIRLGAYPILALPAQRRQDLASLCATAAPVAWIVAPGDPQMLAIEIRAQQPGLRHVIVDGDAANAADADTACLTLDQVAAAGGDIDIGNVRRANDIALLLLSGGSTGTPKLIPRTHRDYLYNFTASASLCGFDANTIYLAVLPAAHNFVLGCPGILGTLASGGTVVMSPYAQCDEAMPLIERERVTHVALVPPLARLWAESREWETSNLSSLRMVQVGGARIDAAAARTISDRLGCALQQVYGMAEGLLCYTRPGDPPDVLFETQGRPLSSEDLLRIVDSEDQQVPDGNSGELLTRGPYTIGGYYRAPAHNARAFTADGFFRTGDLVLRRPDGNVVVVGRVKEQIQRAGEKIPAAVVETALCACTGIRDAVVVPVPDALLGERIGACLQAGNEEDIRPDAAALRAALLAYGLAAHQLPDQILWLDAWPLTAAGKIDRRRLTEIALADDTLTDDATPNRHYHSATVPISSDPLELAVRIAESEAASVLAVYERDGEWSIGLDAALTVRCDATGTVTGHDGRTISGGSPCSAMHQALSAMPIKDWRAYGRASFEFARLLQGKASDVGDPLIELIIPAREIRLRHGQAIVRCIDDGALAPLAAWISRLDAEPALPDTAPITVPPASGDADAYQAAVASAIVEIRAGRYDKVILSRRLPVPGDLSLPLSYRAGRLANTPARSFLWRDSTVQAYGFSPETVVEVEADGSVTTQPLAGTRARTGDADVDARLRRDLLSDAKEISEHAVSVALALDELRTICGVNPLVVDEFMAVRSRGTVQHLASRLRGRLAAGANAWDALAALFPAVTASGIPKSAAIDSIGRHEAAARGLYSGCVMTIDANGAMDAALVLRAAFRQGRHCWLQAGAGIVRDSRPAREWEETCEKLASVALHLRQERAPG